MSDARAADSLNRGIETAKAGNKLLARLHLLQAVELAPCDPNCWLWLAWVAESPASAIHSLQRVLDEYPQHELAQIGMRWATAMAEFEIQEDNASSEEPLRIEEEADLAVPQQEVEHTEQPAARLEEEDCSTETTEENARQWDDEPTPGESPFLENETTVESQEPTRDLTLCEPQPAPIEEDDCPVQHIEHRSDELAASQDETLETEADASQTEQSFDWFDREESSSCLSSTEEEEPCGEAAGIAKETDDDQRDSEEQDHFAEAEEARDHAASNAADETLADVDWWQEDPASEEAETSSTEAAEEIQAEEVEEDEPPANPEPVAEWISHPAEAEELFESAIDEEAPSSVTPANEELPLPLVAAEVDSKPEPEQPEDLDFGVTVLVVDDSPTVRKLVAMTLEKNGFTVGSAPDGVVALKSIAEMKPRLILLDITMPRLGGYQLCKLIKKHESTKHIPVIMLSGKDGMFDKVRGKFVGCDDYITKPFDPDVLVEKVTTQLTEHYGIATTQH